jgi:beta-N-acetylhexosaminidase
LRKPRLFLPGVQAERAAAADAIASQAEPIELAPAWQRFHELFLNVGAAA